VFGITRIEAKQKGPLPVKKEELVAALSDISDPTKAPVWRHGFGEWRTVDQVREILGRAISTAAASETSTTSTAGRYATEAYRRTIDQCG
jgi:hypothetical protein